MTHCGARADRLLARIALLAATAASVDAAWWVLAVGRRRIHLAHTGNWNGSVKSAQPSVDPARGDTRATRGHAGAATGGGRRRLRPRGENWAADHSHVGATTTATCEETKLLYAYSSRARSRRGAAPLGAARGLQASASASPSASASASITPAATVTGSASASLTAAATTTPPVTLTPSLTPPATLTPSRTGTQTATPTPLPTATVSKLVAVVVVAAGGAPPPARRVPSPARVRAPYDRVRRLPSPTRAPFRSLGPLSATPSTSATRARFPLR